MKIFSMVLDKILIDSFCKNTIFSNDMYINCDELRDAIKHLDNNKSCGTDGIYAEHLKIQ